MFFLFIVPVYNMEWYVSDCLYPILVLCNTNFAYELIVVDCSTDNSLQFIYEMTQYNSRVKVIYQDNQGLSMVQNNGFAQASEKFVWFVVSDNGISELSFNLIEKYLEYHNVDALPFSTICVTGKAQSVKPDSNALSETVMTGSEVINNPQWSCQVQYTIYHGVYLLEYNIRMMPSIYHKDKEFRPRFYFHLKRDFDIIILVESLTQFAKSQVVDEDKLCFFIIIADIMNNSLSNCWLLLDEEKHRFDQLLKEKAYLLDLMRKSGGKYYCIEGSVFSQFLTLAPSLHRILGRCNMELTAVVKDKNTPTLHVEFKIEWLWVNGYEKACCLTHIFQERRMAA